MNSWDVKWLLSLFDNKMKMGRDCNHTKWQSLPGVCDFVGVIASLFIISLIIAICCRSETGIPGTARLVLCLYVDATTSVSARIDLLRIAFLHLSTYT